MTPTCTYVVISNDRGHYRRKVIVRIDGAGIVKLEQTRLADGSVQALRGAGSSARTDAIALSHQTRHHDAR